MAMTHRERLVAVYHNQPVDRVPDLEFGLWGQTYERWRKEGMPKVNEPENGWDAFMAYFHPDDFGVLLDLISGPTWGCCRRFEYKVLEEKGDHIIAQDGDGAVAEMIRPELGASIPHYLRYAIETKADWEKMRDERLNPSGRARYRRR